MNEDRVSIALAKVDASVAAKKARRAASLAATSGHKRLPPYGKQFIEQGGYAWVATGAAAWELPKQKTFPVMVLPHDADPRAFAWPVRDLVVTVVELGSFDTERLDILAYALMRDGARRVIAAREAYFADRTCALDVYVRDRP